MNSKTATLLLGLVIWAIVGAVFWARGRDPLQRVWFSVQTPAVGNAACVAVLPKLAPRPLPVVVYLHGSGGSLLGSGNELRQMAELGVAAVGMEYSQTNEAAFEAQFAALQVWLRDQQWADTNKVAWVGFSLGAQRQLSFALKHPESLPQLIVRIAGGWIPELAASSRMTEDRPLAFDLPPLSVLILHGEQDSVFPMMDAQRVAAVLQTNGLPVELKSFPNEAHGFGPNRGVLFRGIGEYCLRHFNGTDAFAGYGSILAWQAGAKPLWLFWLPAMAWGAAWWFAARRRRLAQRSQPRPKLTRREVGLRWLAAILGLLAVSTTAIHLLLPRREITSRTLAIAGRHLVSPKARQDFEFLKTNSTWSGKQLRTLLQHVELANYNRELINWKLDDEIYSQFVLSPEIAPDWDGDMHWRRSFWESFYPRIRKEHNPEAAAGIVVRHLRERVSVVADLDSPTTIAAIWRRQLTNERGFEAVYVAALRSAGVPARLNAQGAAESWNGVEWKPAPRPIVEALQ